MNSADHSIDATGDALEEVTDMASVPEPAADPALLITAALAQELQTVYAGDHQKLEAATRTLRQATRSKA